MARASVASATTVNTGVRRMPRRAYLTSRPTASSIGGLPVHLREQLGFQRAAWSIDDDARRRAVRVELAGRIHNPAFRRGCASANVDHAGLAAQQARVLGDRA